MPIDIESLTEAQLVDLNHRIIARLRFLRQEHAHHKMLQFKLGDHVHFPSDGRGMKSGIITRYNKKTVTIITDDGERWNVSPALLARPAHEEPPRTAGGNLPERKK